ncbi:MAG: hypothetical protein ACHQ2F_00750 [Desulfobaccales bacterium]
MSTKKVKYNKQGIEQLPNDKPVLYRIETESGNPNYIGIAQRGWVRERLSEHLGEIPGAMVRIEQFSSITDAQKKEINVIKRTQAKYNKQGK